MFDLTNIAAEAATTIVLAGVTVWRVYRKWQPRIKAAFNAIHWVEDHLKTNAPAKQAIAEVAAAATTDDTAYRDVLIKSALQDFLLASRFEIANITNTEFAAAIRFVTEKVPEPFAHLVDPDLVKELLETLSANAALDANHEAIKAALVLQQPIQQPKEAM